MSNPIATIETNQGTIEVELYPEVAPKTVENFIGHIKSGYYQGVIFHRVIKDFMIQGGGLTADLVTKPTAEPIVNESKNRLHNTRGTIAMARSADPDSATSQFFINQRNNLRLDWAPGRPGYTVFGEVILGMDVVDFIATAPTRQAGGMADVPQEPILIEEILRTDAE